jgi:hypothetical protein
MKRMGIEELLRWAYRDELPKMQSGGQLLPLGYGGAWGGAGALWRASGGR